MKLCEKLVKLRKESGMTQEELAEKIFVTRTAVSKWENDKGYPGIDSLKLLSRLYGISLDELISEEDVTAVRQAKIKRGRTFYILAVVCLALTAAFALAAWLSQIPWFLLPSAARDALPAPPGAHRGKRALPAATGGNPSLAAPRTAVAGSLAATAAWKRPRQ